MTFLELLVVMVVMSAAVAMFANMVMHTARQRGINRENSIAANAARTQVELMRNEDFRDIFALYNGDPSDDPDGAGTAPGDVFAVQGLTTLETEPLAGRILFPCVTVPRVEGTWGMTTLDTTAIKLLDPTAGISTGGGDPGGGEETGTTHHVLREDYLDLRFGMPRDLNGDSLIDNVDHSEDYLVLPVHVQIRWRGSFGPRQHDLYTQIALFEKADD